MTINNDIRRNGPYRAINPPDTGPFTYGFRIIANTDIKVIKTNALGVNSTLVLTTDYNVAGVGLDAGGTVTLIVGLAQGETVTLLVDPALTQTLDLKNQGDYSSQDLEDALDRLVQITLCHFLPA